MGKVSLSLPTGKLLHVARLSSIQGPVSSESIFLLFDSFQIRTIAGSFSDVSLDIVEWAEGPVIFHTDPNPLFAKNSFSGEILKFALLKDPYWRDCLRSVGEVVVWMPNGSEEPICEVPHHLPILVKKVKQLYLSAEGQVKLM